MAVEPSGLRLNRNTWRFLNERADEYISKFNACHAGQQELLAASTRRQMRTASHILDRLGGQRGVLLADDVGLGKTTVAALVACVVAGGLVGERRMRVRILA